MQDTIDVVVISSGFFGYGDAVAAELSRRGRSVARIDDRPATSTFAKAVIRLNPDLVRPWSDRYFAAQISSLRASEVRDVLVIRGQALSPTSIGLMRKTWPRATLTLYMWDGFRNLARQEVANIPLFDRVFTFDLVDAAANATLTYQPLFYLDAYLQQPGGELVPEPAQLLFVGTLHSDRMKVLAELERSLPDAMALNRYIYVRSALAFRFQALFDSNLRRARNTEFIYSPLSPKEIASLMSRSAAIVDVERETQAGFTMRTIETLAAQRKLITTNPKLTAADFYDPANVLVVDRANPRVDPDFLREPFRPTPEAIVRRYSLGAWLDQVLPSESTRPTDPPSAD